MFIQNYGHMPLPLNSLAAEGFIQKSNIQTFNGQYYYINPCRIAFENPDWDEKLQNLVDNVAIQMGCNGKVISKIKKLKLYKEGSHLLKHKIDLSDKTVFATLVIQLPSVHEGKYVLLGFVGQVGLNMQQLITSKPAWAIILWVGAHKTHFRPA